MEGKKARKNIDRIEGVYYVVYFGFYKLVTFSYSYDMVLLYWENKQEEEEEKKKILFWCSVTGIYILLFGINILGKAVFDVKIFIFFDVGVCGCPPEEANNNISRVLFQFQA